MGMFTRAVFKRFIAACGFVTVDFASTLKCGAKLFKRFIAACGFVTPDVILSGIAGAISLSAS